MNFLGIWAIYKFEMHRSLRTLGQSLISPVITTTLYFVVFGSAIGSTINNISGVQYAAFIVPGLIMLTILAQASAMLLLGYTSRAFLGRCMKFYPHRFPFLRWPLGLLGRPRLNQSSLPCCSVSQAFRLNRDHASLLDGFFLDHDMLHFSLIGFAIGLWLMDLNNYKPYRFSS